MSKAKHNLKIGDSVVVKAGVKDPDLGGDIGGWQGRITELDEDNGVPTAVIAWDSITLQGRPHSMIAHCEKEGLDWQVMGLDVANIEPASPRDSQKDIELAVNEIYKHTAWVSLNEEGGRIQDVLDGIDPSDTMAQLEAWEEFLGETLTFPFDAEVVELLRRGPLRIGDHVKVIDISLVDDLYGIIVGLRRGKEHFDFPLCDLEVTNKESANYQPVRDYRIWYANR